MRNPDLKKVFEQEKLEVLLAIATTRDISNLPDAERVVYDIFKEDICHVFPEYADLDYSLAIKSLRPLLLRISGGTIQVHTIFTGDKPSKIKSDITDPAKTKEQFHNLLGPVLGSELAAER